MASFTERIRKLFRRGANRKQPTTETRAQTETNAQQPLNQHDGANDSVQQTPKVQSQAKVAKAATTTGSLQVRLQNQTNSSTVYAYISAWSNMVIITSEVLTRFASWTSDSKQ